MSCQFLYENNAYYLSEYLLVFYLFIGQSLVAKEITWDWEEWSALMSDTPCESRIETARSVYEKRKSEPSKELLKFLHDDCFLIQMVAIQSIGEQKILAALPILHKLLLSEIKKEDKFLVNYRNDLILWAILELNLNSSINILSSYLNREAKANRQHMAEQTLEALGRFENKSSVRIISTFLYDNNRDPYLRGKAIEILSRMKNEEAASVFRDAITSSDRLVHNWANIIKKNNK